MINQILALGAEAFEIVVAVIVVIATSVALFFLYRNVAFEISELKRNKQAMKERQEFIETGGVEEEDSELYFTQKEVKDIGLFALINHEIRSSKEGNLSALYCINLDDFRHVVQDRPQKDTDRVIGEIDKRLKKLGGKDAVTGHLDDDVFIYFYNGTVDAESIERIGGEIQQAINEPIKNVEQQLTASIGIVVFPYDGINAEQLYKNAEVAVYVAKKEGKNRTHMYSEDLITTEQSNIKYYQEIKKSIQKDEFLLYYQTIVDVKTGKIIGLESLLRWNHPTKGILPPGKFLNVMELTGDITWFGTWGFEKTVMQYKNWSSKTRVGDLFISTNLSPKQLEVEGLAHQFYIIAKKYGLSPELFCLEIINYYQIIRSHTALTNIAQFRKYGFRIAIDDMGNQFEIIEDMKHINASIFKLSRDNVLLLMDKNEDTNDSIKQVIREAKECSKVVIAEGIENEEMIKRMYDLDIRFMQGYYFNQPKSVIEVEAMIMKSPWDMDSFDSIIGS
ncbi:MAG: GGDEF and EAL domain-containing protein [Bacilli bacterium]|nr:GGDEF and EAL domain-containing protein [Bacilli bacterium]